MGRRTVGRAKKSVEELRQEAEAMLTDYRLEEQVGHMLRRAHQRHTAIFQERMTHLQLTPLQFAALIKLSDVGTASQNHLGRLTAMDAATMQGVIKRMIARGLIERRPDPDDRRRLILTLTPEGRELARDAADLGAEISDITLEPLGESDRKLFMRLLGKVAP